MNTKNVNPAQLCTAVFTGLRHAFALQMTRDAAIESAYIGADKLYAENFAPRDIHGEPDMLQLTDEKFSPAEVITAIDILRDMVSPSWLDRLDSLQNVVREFFLQAEGEDVSDVAYAA